MDHTVKTQPGNQNGMMTRLAKQAAEKVAHGAAGISQDAASHLIKEPANDWFRLMKDYAREKPDVVMCWCFAVGVVMGWKLRP